MSIQCHVPLRKHDFVNRDPIRRVCHFNDSITQRKNNNRPISQSCSNYETHVQLKLTSSPKIKLKILFFFWNDLSQATLLRNRCLFACCFKKTFGDYIFASQSSERWNHFGLISYGDWNHLLVEKS